MFCLFAFLRGLGLNMDETSTGKITVTGRRERDQCV